MNQMYDMSIVTHYYSVIGILVVILINTVMLRRAVNIKDYQRQMSLFTPIGSMAIGGILFTGIVMMAAKHLDFSVENIIMIVFSLVIIYLEVKRAKGLKYLNPNVKNALDNFKKYASYLLFGEVVLTLSISLWMLF
ncbi:MAG: putative membrane protein [Sulfurimonas sp.]|jgi:uncharacterized membrane protein|uniref:hypothetical protein n=1 Tax=Sulfurimonas sp. TaxID=2022749 RepID=UPI0039E4D441